MSRQIESVARLVQSEALTYLAIVVGLNLIFIVFAGLLLWITGQTVFALSLAKGYGLFWMVALITVFVLKGIQRIFRVDTPHSNTYVLSNLGHGVILLAGWSAFAALSVRDFIPGSSTPAATILWLVAGCSSIVAFIIVTAFYRGAVYRTINVLTAVASFLAFAIWPASARVTCGWFLNLFG